MNNERVKRARPRGRAMAVALAVALGAMVLSGGLMASPAGAATSCGDPGVWDPLYFRTINTGYKDGRTFELRFATQNRCGWSRVTNSSSDGDRVYVDISRNGGTTWEGPLAKTKRATSSTTQFYSNPAYQTNDTTWIRACGNTNNNSSIICLPWY